MLMHVVFQLLLSVYNAYLRNEQLSCITLVPQGRSLASFVVKRKSYHIPLPILLLANFEPRTTAWVDPLVDVLVYAHPSNRKILQRLL